MLHEKGWFLLFLIRNSDFFEEILRENIFTEYFVAGVCTL